MTLTRAYLLVIQEETPKSVSLKPEEESQNEVAKPGFWLEREGQHEASRITPAHVGRRWNTSFWQPTKPTWNLTWHKGVYLYKRYRKTSIIRFCDDPFHSQGTPSPEIKPMSVKPSLLKDRKYAPFFNTWYSSLQLFYLKNGSGSK